MWPGIGALRVWRRDYESWKRFAYSFVITSLGNPLFYLVAIGYGLGRFVTEFGGVPYAVFLAPGIIAAAAMNSASFETTFGSFTRMTEQNTYLAILATPCSVADVVAGDILFAATKSAFGSLLVLGVTTWFGLVQSPVALGVVPAAFLTGLCFGGLGMIVTAWAVSYNFFDYYFTLVISLMFFFSGVFFPLQSLPAWAQAVAWCLPLTHAVALCRALLAGSVGPILLVHVAALLAVAAAAFVVAERLVRRRLLV